MNLDAIRAAAEHVTPGPYLRVATEVKLPEGGLVCATPAVSDARYFALLDPQTVLRLLDVVKHAEAIAARYHTGDMVHAVGTCDECDMVRAVRALGDQS